MSIISCAKAKLTALFVLMMIIVFPVTRAYLCKLGRAPGLSCHFKSPQFDVFLSKSEFSEHKASVFPYLVPYLSLSL